jgi:DNA-binding transcriptional ArsR family regulator
MRPTSKHVTDPGELRALAHPLRVRLLGALRIDGPATASELGRRFCESSGSTSYHLRQLARYGFVVDDPEPASRRERRWRAAQELTSWTRADFASDPATSEAARWLQLHQLRQQQAMAAQFEDEAREWSRAWIEAATQNDRIVRLTPAALSELEDRLEGLLEEYEGRCAGAPDSERVAVYFAAYPFRRLPW